MSYRIVIALLLFASLTYAEVVLARAGGAPGGAPAGAPAGAPSGGAAGGPGAPGPSGSTGAPAAGAPAAGDNSAATTGPGDGLGGAAAGVSQDPRLYRSPASLPGSAIDPAASPRGTAVAPSVEIAPNTPLMCPGINAWDPRRC